MLMLVMLMLMLMLMMSHAGWSSRTLVRRLLLGGGRLRSSPSRNEIIVVHVMVIRPIGSSDSSSLEISVGQKICIFLDAFPGRFMIFD